MSWIRSDQALLRHPKTILLKALLKIDMDAVVGRLHMLWWWCLDYALDGDLSKHDIKVIEESCNVPLKILCKAGFVDSRPYRRIHDWWDNQGNYLKLRFRDHPEIWMRIRDLYEKKSHASEHMSKHASEPKGKPVDVDSLTDVRTFHTNGRTDEKKEKQTREASRLRPSAPRLPALETKIENPEPEFTHEDFAKLGHCTSEKPREDDKWAWTHLERKLTNEERIMSKLREKNYVAVKWA